MPRSSHVRLNDIAAPWRSGRRLNYDSSSSFASNIPHMIQAVTASTTPTTAAAVNEPTLMEPSRASTPRPAQTNRRRTTFPRDLLGMSARYGRWRSPLGQNGKDVPLAWVASPDFDQDRRERGSRAERRGADVLRRVLA